MDIDKLVEELARRGLSRPTNADPRDPPEITVDPGSIPHDPGSTTHEPGTWFDEANGMDMPPVAVPVDVDGFLKPVRAGLEEDRYYGDWLEECHGYGLLESDARPETPWDTEGGRPHVDAWAWYCPFHFYEDECGIYVRGDKLGTLSRRILMHTTLRERQELRGPAARSHRLQFGYQLKQAAFLHLFLHEMYHHKAEAFATRLEIAQGRPKYVPYHDSVYRRLTRPLSSPASDALLEEGLANADVIRRLKSEPAYGSRQFPRLPGCPSMKVLWERYEFAASRACWLPGYRRVNDYLAGKNRFKEGAFFDDQRALQQCMDQASVDPVGDKDQWSFAPNMFASFWNKDIITYELVYPGSTSRITPGLPIQAVQASPRKVIRAARRWGIHKHREAAGDHAIYVGRGGRKATVDTGYGDLPRACWDDLLDIVNADHGTKFRNNEDGRRRFLAGPGARQ